MSYSVMQTKFEALSQEQFEDALRQVPGLTAMDVNILGKDAFGVLAKGFELEQASAMQTALATQGVEAEIVADDALPQLPPPRQLIKAQFTPEALLMDDLMGRSSRLEWNDIQVIAAGRARLTEFTTELVDKVVGSYATRELAPRIITQAIRKEEQKEHLLLEIITRGAAARYHTIADKPETAVLFQCLGEERGKDPAANLAVLVQELAKLAPAALLNYGAQCMNENNDPTFYYPSKQAFQREIIWLLWMVSSGRVQDEQT